MNLPNKQPWYKDGLSFKCTECGKCCQGCPGYVWVTLEEIEKMAAFLEISIEDFSKEYLRKIGNRLSLKELPNKEYSCVFLKETKCSIYPVRPKQCRTYPYWPQVLKSQETWEQEKKTCEGISEGGTKVSYEEIQRKGEFS